MTHEFKGFPKMARLNREMIVTEKIDGTNAAVAVVALKKYEDTNAIWQNNGVAVYAQSRTRIITPESDNFGFAAWVKENAEELSSALGLGCHFGEWWGSGIQRKYGFKNGERFFSLFNTIRWCAHDEEPKRIETADPRIEKWQEKAPACCHIVPELYRGPFDTPDVGHCLERLRREGSLAAPGFNLPEGVVVYHVAGNIGFKVTLENDDMPKTLQK